MVMKVHRRTLDPEVEVWHKSSWDVFGVQAFSFFCGVVIRCPLILAC
jgi:hypothetical protein